MLLGKCLSMLALALSLKLRLGGFFPHRKHPRIVKHHALALEIFHKFLP